jgi:hypothetical protein
MRFLERRTESRDLPAPRWSALGRLGEERCEAQCPELLIRARDLAGVDLGRDGGEREVREAEVAKVALGDPSTQGVEVRIEDAHVAGA